MNKENLETEVKIPVDKETFEKVIKELWSGIVACGDSGPRFKEEINIFYKVPKGFLRLRDYDGEVKVTYKSERKDSRKINSREEIEFEYPKGDFEKMKLFFSRIGLEKHLEYTKKRANYYFDDGYLGGVGAVASFDILPSGKRYIEIEDIDPSGEAIPHIRKMLGLENHQIEKRSYLEIVGSGA